MKKQFFTVSEWMSYTIQTVLQNQRQTLKKAWHKYELAAALAHLLHHVETYRVLKNKVETGWQHKLAKCYPTYTTEGLLRKCNAELACYMYVCQNLNINCKINHYWNTLNRKMVYYFDEELDLVHAWEKENNITLWKL